MTEIVSVTTSDRDGSHKNDKACDPDGDRNAGQETDRDTECTLTFDSQSAVVSPFGASLRRYFVTTDQGEWNAVWGYQGGNHKRGGQGDVLIPFPGRIRNGQFAFNDQQHQLVKNDKDGPNAIHGFLRARLFRTLRSSAIEVAFACELNAPDSAIPGYPYPLSVEITYSLGKDGLRTQFAITNTGGTPAPVGAGFHPYFSLDCGDFSEWLITIPASKFIELKDLLPTGRALKVEGTPLDFREARAIGETRYNDCVTALGRGADGFSTASISSGDGRRCVALRMDPSFDYVVIYTGDQIPAPGNRQAIALEPMTCAPDAFNHADWGTRTLLPGEILRGHYFIHATSVEL